MKVCAVIVTYGNRFNLLKEVIESCLKAHICKIIVVDNNSHPESRRKLKELETSLDKLKVIYLSENKGSAGGFKIGLEEAYRDNVCEYILTLDDDNVIPPDALEKVKYVLCYLNKYKEDEIMLSFYRPIWCWDKKAVHKGWIKSYKPNNFLGFNFWEKIFAKLKEKFYKGNRTLIYPLVPAEVAAMGGLFFSKKVIDRIGYPREDFFLYAEDHEYTYRFTDMGGKIFLCSEIVVNDLDQTYYNTNSHEKIHLFHKSFSEIRLYYVVRNHVFFSNIFVKNKLFFYGNLIAYCLIKLRYVFRTEPQLFIRRYKILLRAIKDGLKGNLGKTF